MVRRVSYLGRQEFGGKPALNDHQRALHCSGETSACANKARTDDVQSYSCDLQTAVEATRRKQQS